ncbi:thermonuclease family protein [Pararhizobium gei]|uniref:thermonuclease family protein n=1 Tax=Pararhizobium gei TaxID=1395951 RepID=UPI0023DAA360|nr:thermonuclease family protein [Rhizobium gei]
MGRLVRILRNGLLTVTLLLLAGLIVVRLEDAGQRRLGGAARVIDGDTIVVARERIRLAGIDAPELLQVCRKDGGGWPCGREARGRLSALIAGAAAMCRTNGNDRYGRLLGVCEAGGRDLNAAMVASGYAVAFGDYQAEEADARRMRLGVWAGPFDKPRVWRKTHGGMEDGPHGQEGPGEVLAMAVRDWLTRLWSWIANG